MMTTFADSLMPSFFASGVPEYPTIWCLALGLLGTAALFLKQFFDDRRHFPRRLYPGRCGARIISRPVAVQPYSRYAHRSCRHDVMVPTTRHVYPIFLRRSGDFGESPEMRERRLVIAHLLRGDDEVERFLKIPLRQREQIL